MHEPIDLYELKYVIEAELQEWLGDLTGKDSYYIAPYQISHVLQRMQINGCPFRIDGASDGSTTVQLLESPKQALKPAVSLKRIK